ncbi:expressed unknown protein [Seminavis robusta]|uniref:Uncharacterized protein n=1 Tax=Seminavis robusta TaxID=568900 RepID=A0A9N8EJ62_9STRA|nr:expressed unknown protein [Seminavis robusta]|eukprot:Sro1225_g254070.1 n/a (266) ;mRNA; f:8137-8934
MVVAGNYSVRIVNAETKEPFKEHTGPDGKVYAEVEPDMEYFIEVEVVGGDPASSRSQYNISVDGKKLPYCGHAKSFGKKYKGNWSRVNGVETTQAFVFQRPEFSERKGSSPGALMGDIKLEFYEAIYSGTRSKLKDVKPDSFQADSVSSSLTHRQTKKVLRSGTGSVVETKTRNKVRKTYSKGAFLESITIHYCTALGLVHAGVFGKVDDIWAKARIVNPWKPSSDGQEQERQQPKRIKREAKTVNGVKVEAPKVLEVFDLTGDE